VAEDPPPVLASLPIGSGVPTAARLQAELAPLLARPALGRSASAQVIDVTTGTVLYGLRAGRAVVPASTAKILTGAAALSVLGPDTTLPTRTVVGARPDEVVLVGGGDVMLAPGRGSTYAVQGHAGLADLADATVRGLRARRVSAIGLRLDDSLFRGSPVSPAWRPGDVAGGFVAPVMALEVSVGTARPGHLPRPGLPAPRVADPAMSAARQFAALLARRGITVVGTLARARAPERAAVLGEVRSASIADLVEHDLTDSDNTTAEVLAHLIAIAGGRPATFADGGQAVLAAVGRLGVPVTGARMPGGSGLGNGYALSAATVARTLVLAASADRPQLRPLLTGLPVAGASGTLGDRFTGATAAAGLGVVRAKTGTLTGVGALAGTVVDADDRLLVFVLVADRVPAVGPGRTALDAVAGALARCGCR
jgi:D-alanyl-D-alanine carboxypeptidase/D-alanyl-D-alanine-endopeptidase (penicillin-binding protein 4)